MSTPWSWKTSWTKGKQQKKSKQTIASIIKPNISIPYQNDFESSNWVWMFTSPVVARPILGGAGTQPCQHKEPRWICGSEPGLTSGNICRPNGTPGFRSFQVAPEPAKVRPLWTREQQRQVDPVPNKELFYRGHHPKWCDSGESIDSFIL